MKFTNKAYDIAKFIAQIVIPAVGTFLFTLATIFGWDWGDKLVGVLTAVDVLLGSILAISSNQYYKEEQVEDKEDTEKEKVSDAPVASKDRTNVIK